MKKIQKNEEKKLSLEKFKVAEIKNKKAISGGGNDGDDTPATSPTMRQG